MQINVLQQVLIIPNLTKFYQGKNTKIKLSFQQVNSIGKNREPGYPSFKETKHGTQPIIVSFFFFFFKKFKTDVTQPIIVTGPFWDPDLNKPKAKGLFVHNRGVSVNFKNYS